MTDVHFNGPEYDPQYDQSRLEHQLDRIRALMKDGEWRTLKEIAKATGDPEASISAQLRHLRKPRFGRYTVERRARDDRERGLFEYRLGERGSAATPREKEVTVKDSATWLDENCQDGWVVEYFGCYETSLTKQCYLFAFQARRIEPRQHNAPIGNGSTNKAARDELARKLGWEG